MVSESKSLRLTSADLIPVAGQAGLRPGLPPLWNDFQAGRLLERPIMAALYPVFDDWRKRVTSAPNNAPSVFCLCGQGGDGKSVLLLQLAARLLRGNNVPALDLLAASDEPQIFETPPANDVAWHFVDRLPELLHGAAGEFWLRRLREQSPPGFVVTTATPAACDWFAKRYPKKIALTVWQLPPLTEMEAAALAVALGNEAGAKSWRKGMTLESFLFALKNGTALAEHLDALAVESLPVVVAANLLGLAAPVSLLPPEKIPLAQKLADDGLLPVHISASGLRLFTPGLAQPLFEPLFPDSETRVAQVAAGFAQLLEIWLRENNAAAASWFLRRLLHGEHLGNLLPPRHHPLQRRLVRKNLFRELYRQHRLLHGEQPAVALLPVWLEIGQAIRLRPDVMIDAASVLELAPDSVSPALAADIWHFSEYRKNPLATRMRQGVANYFKVTKANSGAALARLYAETNQCEPALPILQRWLETHPFDSHFGNAFDTVLTKLYRRGEVQTWALECLGFFWRGKAAAKPFAWLLKHNPQGGTIRLRARSWLAANAAYPEAGVVLRELLGDGHGELRDVRAALLWTAQFPVHPAAGGLWETLLSHHAGQNEVRSVALEWIKACPQHPHAAAMLLAIARKEKNNPAFVATVQRWLETQPTHEQTPVLLETLASSTDESLRRLLAQWLDQHPQHPAAARLLAAVLCAGKIGDGWMARAEKFLRSGHPDALRVLRVLLGTSANDDVLKLVWELLPKVSLPEQKKLSRWLGKLSGQQPERVAGLRQGLPEPSELAEEFFSSLRETLWEMPMVQLRDWMKRGFMKLSDPDQQWFFQRLLAHDTPLPQPFSEALAVWLQRNFKLPAYKPMLQILRQHPKQGRYFHSASMLPLNLLAEIMAAGEKPRINAAF